MSNVRALSVVSGRSLRYSRSSRGRDETSKPKHTKGHSDERPDQTDPVARTDPDSFAVGQQDPQPPADAALEQSSVISRQ